MSSSLPKNNSDCLFNDSTFCNHAWIFWSKPVRGVRCTRGGRGLHCFFVSQLFVSSLESVVSSLESVVSSLESVVSSLESVVSSLESVVSSLESVVSSLESVVDMCDRVDQLP